jgi:exodeoxyribonuclease-5
MILSPEQDAGLQAIDEWINDPDRWMFFLAGYAGTGKTTLIQHLINSMNKKPLCLAPTGKAATVLQRKLIGCTVSTVHSALYTPLKQNTTRLLELIKEYNATKDEQIMTDIRLEKDRLANERPTFSKNQAPSILPGDLIIIDEASMVSNRMMDDLGNTKAKVLFVGDTGQLPPVNDNGYFTYGHPDHMLETVQRQALDNPIIRLSMDIRLNRKIPAKIDETGFTRMHKNEFDEKSLSNFDQVMAGTNVVRRKVNRMVRRHLGWQGTWPLAGEKMICLKNQYKFGTWIINGIQCTVVSAAQLHPERFRMEMDIMYEDGLLSNLPFYPYNIEVHYNDQAEQEPYEMRRDLVEIDYAYCITVHKSQGSEWDRVLLLDDKLMADRADFRRRWLYTAVTRAKEHITWLDGC